MPTNLTAKLSSFFLSASLLLTGACSSATRNAVDAGVSGPKPAPIVAPVVVQPVAPDADRAALRAKLLERREQTVARFLAYREARSYPINSYMEGLQHVWLDELGQLCAAATVISADWGFDVTAAVAIEDNFIKLADVHDGPLLDWILTSGLTRHELVAIQEPMEYQGKDLGMWRGPDPAELDRLHAIYVSVERQIEALWDESLDEAVDALAAHPELAESFLRGELPGAGKYVAMASGHATIDAA